MCTSGRAVQQSANVPDTVLPPALISNDQSLLQRHLFLELSSLHLGKVAAIEEILGALRRKPIPGAAMAVQMDFLADDRNPVDAQRLAVRRKMGTIIESTLVDFPASLLLDAGANKFVVIQSPGPLGALAESEYRRAAEQLRCAAEADGRGTLTVGLGKMYHDAEGLARSYQEAQEALSYQIFLGNNRVITWSNDLATTKVGVVQARLEPFPVDRERKLRQCIIAGDKEGAFEALDVLLESIRSQPRITPDALKFNLVQIVVVLCRSAARIGADVGKLSSANLEWAKAILASDSYPALCNLMRQVVSDLILETFCSGKKTPSDVVLQAKKYVSENGIRSPSLREVADYVHLSPYYFSRLFARENGCSFHEYLTKMKIEAAKDLLCNSQVNIRQAALRVGFKDVSYFTELFRRSESMTPTMYRRCVGQVAIRKNP